MMDIVEVWRILGDDGMRERYRLQKLPYQEFLASDFWRDVRETLIQRVGRKCERCGAKSHLQVHHKDYLYRAFEDFYPERMEVLCRQCHKGHHDFIAAEVARIMAGWKQ